MTTVWPWARERERVLVDGAVAFLTESVPTLVGRCMLTLSNSRLKPLDLSA